MGDGRWAMGDGRWAMGDERWAMGDGRWGDGVPSKNKTRWPTMRPRAFRQTSQWLYGRTDGQSDRQTNYRSHARVTGGFILKAMSTETEESGTMATRIQAF